MQNHRAPIIIEGQVYYDEAKNAYLVVTRRVGEMITYSGQAFKDSSGFRGRLEDEQFIELFQPVDLADLTQDEKQELLSFCVPGTQLKTGFIKEEA